MIQKTKWRPDTCKCELEYEWDDAVPIEERVHTFASANMENCPHHDDVDETLFQKVSLENVTKNKAIGFAIESYPELEGKQNEFEFNFDTDRNISVKLPTSETPIDKAVLAEEFNSQDLVPQGMSLKSKNMALGAVDEPIAKPVVTYI